MLLKRYSPLSRSLASSFRHGPSVKPCGPRPQYRPYQYRDISTTTYLPQWEIRDNLVRYTKLKSRSLIRLTGADVEPFIQGLVTADVSKFVVKEQDVGGTPLGWESRQYYTAFLNAQGRVLTDAIIWPATDNRVPDGTVWIIDVDSNSSQGLISHLKKHKLRSKVKIEKVPEEDLVVHFAWPAKLLEREQIPDSGHDPRPAMGIRILARPDDGLALDNAVIDAVDDEYKIHRMLQGIAEGPEEIISGSALPQESNVDFFGGIDFRKGCYLGQELTIRTHHTGVVRKRILPVQIYNDQAPVGKDAIVPDYNPDSGLTLPPPGSNIAKVSSRGRSTGKWLGGVGNIGLALCRLEMMTDIRLTEEPTQYDPDQEFKISWEAEGGRATGEVKVKPFVPGWMRDSIAAGLKSRERTSKKDEEMDEVD